MRVAYRGREALPMNLCSLTDLRSVQLTAASQPSWWACWFLGCRLLSPLLPPKHCCVRYNDGRRKNGGNMWSTELQLSKWADPPQKVKSALTLLVEGALMLLFQSGLMSSCRWFSPHHLSEYSFFFLCRYELVKGRRVKGSTRAEAPVMLPVTFCGLSSWIRDTNERICLYVSMSVVQRRSGDVALKPFKKSSITSVCFGCLVCLAGCC